jgi:anti-sigma factor RsiW
MSCPETLRTHAFIDGEVDGAEAEAVERHIAGCAECQALCADAAMISDALRAEASRYAAPASLRLRVQAALAAADERRAPARAIRLPRAAPGFWPGLFSGAGVTALAVGLAGLMLLPPSASTLADAVTSAHTDALMHGREIAVVSTDHHTVKPWFAGRIALSPPVADFAAEGYRLVGGRVDQAAGAPAAPGHDRPRRTGRSRARHGDRPPPPPSTTAIGRCSGSAKTLISQRFPTPRSLSWRNSCSSSRPSRNKPRP